jgi:hypothetical protein
MDKGIYPIAIHNDPFQLGGSFNFIYLNNPNADKTTTAGSIISLASRVFRLPITIMIKNIVTNPVPDPIKDPTRAPIIPIIIIKNTVSHGLINIVRILT